MQKIKTIVSLAVCLLTCFFAIAQNGPDKTEIGEFMRSTGRSYVVIAVMLTILAGLILYLVRLEKKIKRLEKES